MSEEEKSAVWYLTEFREVVLLTERTLPQTCGIITDGLVIALSLRPPMSDTSYYTGDQLTCNKHREKHGAWTPSFKQSTIIVWVEIDKHSW